MVARAAHARALVQRMVTVQVEKHDKTAYGERRLEDPASYIIHYYAYEYSVVSECMLPTKL